MGEKQHGGIYYCKDCGNLDYSDGTCSKCKGTNIVPAEQDISFASSAHNHLMKVIYAQHEYGYFDKKSN